MASNFKAQDSLAELIRATEAERDDLLRQADALTADIASWRRALSRLSQNDALKSPEFLAVIRAKPAARKRKIRSDSKAIPAMKVLGHANRKELPLAVIAERMGLNDKVEVRALGRLLRGMAAGRDTFYVSNILGTEHFGLLDWSDTAPAGEEG